MKRLNNTPIFLPKLLQIIQKAFAAKVLRDELLKPLLKVAFQWCENKEKYCIHHVAKQYKSIFMQNG